MDTSHHTACQHGVMRTVSALFVFGAGGLLLFFWSTGTLFFSAESADTHTQDSSSFFSFVVVGHVYPQIPTGGLKFIIEKIREQKPSFVIVTGDSVAGGSSTEIAREQWDQALEFFSDIHAPIHFVPGNHDMSSPLFRAEFLKRFGSLYKSFVYEKHLFVFLDSSGYDVDKIQRAYLTGLLQQSRQFEDIFVFVHHALWFGGKKSVSLLNEDYPSNTWNTSIHPLLKGRVRNVFSGDGSGYRKDIRDGVTYHIDGFSKQGFLDKKDKKVNLGFLVVSVFPRTEKVSVVRKEYQVMINQNKNE